MFHIALPLPLLRFKRRVEEFGLPRLDSNTIMDATNSKHMTAGQGFASCKSLGSRNVVQGEGIRVELGTQSPVVLFFTIYGALVTAAIAC